MQTPKATAPKRGGGPKTPEGKARSSQNSFRHGLTSQTIVLAYENSQEFDDFRQCYFDTFAPANFFEAELVDDMVKAKWRLKRLALYEKIAINCQYDRMKGHYPDPELAENVKVGAMNEAMANCRVMAHLPRYEAGFQRAYYRALNKLLELRAQGLEFGELKPAAAAGQPENQPTSSPIAHRPQAQNQPRREPQASAPPAAVKPKPAKGSPSSSSFRNPGYSSTMDRMSPEEFGNLIDRIMGKEG